MRLASLLLVLLGQAAPAPVVERVTVTVLATTDTHGFIYPYDYFTKQPAARGLAAAAALIQEVRRKTPNTLLVDCGDTIQGSSLAGVYQTEWRVGPRAPEPMMLAMNRIGYDAMVVGNHDFNYGPQSLSAARDGARFPWLSANTETGGALPPFAPYLLKSVGGVKVAVIGITTAAIPQWEKPENIRGLSWLAPEEGVRRALEALEAEKPDVTLVAVHGGLGRDPETGSVRPNEQPGENPAWQIAERFPGLAAVIFGHSHGREPGRRVGGVLLVQPRPWAMELARVDLVLERGAADEAWRLASTSSQLLPVTLETPADPGILELARPYHEAAERYLERPVAEARVALSGERGRFEDTALVDAIHEVQLHYASAQVSLASLFQTRVLVPRGPVTLRELAALYLYDNELYAIEGDGRMVRAALENAARYFKSCPDPSCARGPLVDRTIPGFNYDMAQGVEYEIDLTRPAGERVLNLRYRGAPLRDDQPLRIAVNNYRAAGSAGYSMFRDASIVWRSGREIRDLMSDYWGARKRLPEKPDGNWRLLPPLVVETLVREERVGR